MIIYYLLLSAAIFFPGYLGADSKACEPFVEWERYIQEKKIAGVNENTVRSTLLRLFDPLQEDYKGFLDILWVMVDEIYEPRISLELVDEGQGVPVSILTCSLYYDIAGSEEGFDD